MLAPNSSIHSLQVLGTNNRVIADRSLLASAEDVVSSVVQFQ
jgi:hypothetical protein